MVDIESPPEPANARAMGMQRLIFIAVPVLLVLFAAYWFGLRAQYAPILTSVAPDEAAAIVKVLDAKKIDYRLSDEGRTIQVATNQADKARLELVGSELPIRGQVGFELFNQSDMGLTEFAQKINYQRALQGELARTILLLDDIKSVRVHLGLPERSVFRDEQARPRASITLILRPGAILTESRVSGIQRMVAGAIPEMTPDAVAVLDGTGKIVSTLRSEAQAKLGGSDAVIETYRQRVQAAIEAVEPSLSFALNVSLRVRSPAAFGEAQQRLDDNARQGAIEPDHDVIIRITTPTLLEEGVRMKLMRTIETEAGLDWNRGDRISFVIGEPTATTEAARPSLGNDPVVSTAMPTPHDQNSSPFSYSLAIVIACGLVAIGFLVWMLRIRSRRDLPEHESLKSFAEQLRQRLSTVAGTVS